MLIKTTSLLTATVLAVTLAACGNDDGGGDDATSSGGDSVEMTGSFVAVSDAPAEAEEISGSVEQVRSEAGTETTIELSGLEPDTAYIAHVHAGACDQPDPGGPHYKFDLDGGDMPPNEIHLSFTSDDRGNGEVGVDNETRIPDGEGLSVVVHHDEEADGEMDDSEMGGSGAGAGDEMPSDGKQGKAADGHSHSHSDKLACADLA